MTSKKQETDLGVALKNVVDRLSENFKVRLEHTAQWKLVDIVSLLRSSFTDIEFYYHFDTSAMKPDGGILSILDSEGTARPILITEVKNQGTNDLRTAEGKPRQAKGNAIERLGKNVIGFRTAMMNESIVPFICFGYGCDFADESSILDRVSTIAMFGPLNTINVVNQGESGLFNRGSFFFRETPLTVQEMANSMYEVASRAIYYYFARYGEDKFLFS
ncbi:EcoRI family type II restriction endonuclease [Candidatus Poriferisocius sp.]|uniref:EcoRI family type II restriction endonuclease n=1 Tax=Candidatus Poriferisocius sp. TaxID=3101276 RepID=UPI003B02A51B